MVCGICQQPGHNRKTCTAYSTGNLAPSHETYNYPAPTFVLAGLPNSLHAGAPVLAAPTTYRPTGQACRVTPRVIDLTRPQVIDLTQSSPLPRPEAPYTTSHTSATPSFVAVGAAAGTEAWRQGQISGGKRKATEPKVSQELRTPPEKRLRRYSSAPSTAVLQRIDRALTQRLFLISANTTNNDRQTYTVLGSTGNVYEVTHSSLCSCDCPDALKGNLCKHDLFVKLRVLNLPRTDPLVWQKAFLRAELERLATIARSRISRRDTGVPLADAAVVRTYSGILSGEEVKEAGGATRKDYVGEACPICFEDMNDREKLVWCEGSCGKSLHDVCHKQWEKSGKKTCVYCRAPWAAAPEARAKGRAMVGEEGYTNLAQYSAAHRGVTRETYNPNPGSWGYYWQNRY